MTLYVEWRKQVREEPGMANTHTHTHYQTHTLSHTHIHTHTHTHTHTLKKSPKQTGYGWICHECDTSSSKVSVRVCECNTHKHTCKCTHTHTHRHTYRHAHTHTHALTHTHTHTVRQSDHLSLLLIPAYTPRKTKPYTETIEIRLSLNFALNKQCGTYSNSRTWRNIQKLYCPTSNIVQKQCHCRQKDLSVS